MLLRKINNTGWLLFMQKRAFRFLACFRSYSYLSFLDIKLPFRLIEEAKK